MEQATVAQAEPQGSAAVDQDTSAPASGQEPASSESFGSLFRQHVERRAERKASRAGASSADRQTSAADEQPAPSAQDGSRPGASSGDVDGTASGDAEPSDQPRLSRAQRKALKTGDATGSESPSTADAPDTPTAPTEGGDPDPVVARVERVEQTVTEGLSRLEGLLKPQQASPESSPDDPERALFGPNDEFNRRAEIALHGSTRGQYLDTAEADELAVWASNRKAREFSESRTRVQERSQFSAAILAAAGEFGIDPASIQKPGATLRDVFGAFVSKGEAKKDAELAAANEKLARVEQTNRLLADENEALTRRLPAGARSVLAGGSGAVSRAAQLADRSKMNGRQLMGAGLRQQQNGRRNRPGAR